LLPRHPISAERRFAGGGRCPSRMSFEGLSWCHPAADPNSVKGWFRAADWRTFRSLFRLDFCQPSGWLVLGPTVSKGRASSSIGFPGVLRKVGDCPTGNVLSHEKRTDDHKIGKVYPQVSTKAPLPACASVYVTKTHAMRYPLHSAHRSRLWQSLNDCNPLREHLARFKGLPS
jgi:hypothetical protein